MFESELASKMKQIFKVKKVSYDFPSESREQEALFIEVENVKSSVKDGLIVSMITGNGSMYGSNDKMPFGFFSKCIRQADVTLTKDLFFFDFETNTLRYRDIVERRFGFVYFFNSQYDPAIGTITSIDLEYEESEE